MTEVYSHDCAEIADEAGRDLDRRLPHGVYVALLGPSYETPAEIRYLRKIGVDAVGDVDRAGGDCGGHMGIRCSASRASVTWLPASCRRPLDHVEVMETTRRVRGNLSRVGRASLADSDRGRLSVASVDVLVGQGSRISRARARVRAMIARKGYGRAETIRDEAQRALLRASVTGPTRRRLQVCHADAECRTSCPAGSDRRA